MIVTHYNVYELADTNEASGLVAELVSCKTKVVSCKNKVPIKLI